MLPACHCSTCQLKLNVPVFEFLAESRALLKTPTQCNCQPGSDSNFWPWPSPDAAHWSLSCQWQWRLANSALLLAWVAHWYLALADRLRASGWVYLLVGSEWVREGRRVRGWQRDPQRDEERESGWRREGERSAGGRVGRGVTRREDGG